MFHLEGPNFICEPTQVESAHLDRSYRRAPKGAGDDDYGREGAGVCHLCSCGQGVDWENLQPIICAIAR